MKYGMVVPNRGALATPDNLVTIAKRGEELGYHMLLTGDHILVPNGISSPYPYSPGGEFPGQAYGEAMEQLTLLTFIAGHTKSIRLVTSVMIVPHRNPLVTAKILATLDVLSKGRVTLGVGAGWMREEFEALGIPAFDQRGDVTDEYIRAFKVLWTSDNPSFEGKYCRFSDISFLPKPVQKPHPPIWVGGESPRAIRRTAELGDGWYPIGSNPRFPMREPAQLAAGMKRLAEQAKRAGRDPKEIEVIYWSHDFALSQNGGPSSSGGDRVPFTGNADQIASDIRQYEEMGVSQLVVDFFRSGNSLEVALGQLEDFATKVWPHV